MISAVIGEKSFQINIERSVLLLFEAYCAEKRLIYRLSAESSVMDSAKIYKIECSSSHHKHSLGALRALHIREIVYFSAVLRETELTYAEKLIVIVSGIREKIRVVFHGTELAYLLLFFFSLYR